MVFTVNSEIDMKKIGKAIGENLVGGETIELIGDIGAGKTTLTKGIADGLKIREIVQSPSFTISRLYEGRDGITMYHYDFYRLQEPGIMIDELEESLEDTKSVNIIEWSGSVANILPEDKMTIDIKVNNDDSRNLVLTNFSNKLIEKLEDR
jgi:tRNA threonylcarbamoyladenosine biosynthesis protein TsaE